MSMRPARARDDPRTLSIQPEPLELIDSYIPGPWGGVTAVTRFWRPGDTLRCRLCPLCTASHNRASCQVQVRGRVAAADLPLLSLHDRVIHTSNGADGGIVRAKLGGEAVG